MNVWKPLGSLLCATGVALFAGLSWQLWGTGLVTAAAQQRAAEQLVGPAASGGSGDGAFRIRIPALDVTQVVVDGTGDADLEKGPGHYRGTAGPGETGNVGIAGHRVTFGAPFSRLDELRSCDDIVLVGRSRTWTYRVLPIPGDATPCDLSADTPGRLIVSPDRGDVLNPVGERKLLTLTTCHPKYSARERLIVHAELVTSTPLS